MSVEIRYSPIRNAIRVDMRAVAEVALRSIKERTARAVNSDDQAAKPLDPRYAKQKMRAGANPIRDLRLSGSTIAALKVLAVTATGFVIGFEDAIAEQRASRDEAIEPMLKLSPRDRQAVRRAMQDNIRGER